MEQPIVSVVLTTHNGRKDYCREAIKSVLNQTFKDFELIVMDDASTDGTDEMVREFTDPRIRYIRRETNFGNHSRPKNEGIHASTGKYIGFLDSDNKYRPDHLWALYKTLKENPMLDVAYGMRMKVENGKYTEVAPSYEFDIAELMRGNFIDTSDFLVKKEALMYIGGWDEGYRRRLDWNLIIRLAKAGFQFKRVPLILTDYTFHDDMLSKEHEENHFDPKECKIRLPYLGGDTTTTVAIFSLTYDRITYTRECFASLYEKAGYKFDHYIVDNGSTDGTQEYLKTLKNPNGEIYLQLNEDNKGISIATNQAKAMMKKPYTLIGKVDNDCLFLTDGWLKTIVDVYESYNSFALSCYVQGLRDSVGGATRKGYVTLKGNVVGLTNHLGGICHFVDSYAHRDYRHDESKPLHWSDDSAFSAYLIEQGYSMGYLENVICEHIDGTAGQEERYKEYFERRKLEREKAYNETL